MTNATFAAWMDRHFRSVNAAHKALGIDRDRLTALREGRSRKGSPTPVTREIALMCAAVDVGLLDYDGDRETLLRLAARVVARDLSA